MIEATYLVITLLTEREITSHDKTYTCQSTHHSQKLQTKREQTCSHNKDE
jgi:hypothetical protein